MGSSLSSLSYSKGNPGLSHVVGCIGIRAAAGRVEPLGTAGEPGMSPVGSWDVPISGPPGWKFTSQMELRAEGSLWY